MTEKAVADLNLQPSIDTVWTNRQPEDYAGFSQKRTEFLRSWNHSRNHPHYSVEQMNEYGVELTDPNQSVEQKVVEERNIEQFILNSDIETIELECVSKSIPACIMQEVCECKPNGQKPENGQRAYHNG